ncbi:unnamed protein product [Triticum turgidum subsp. durum]|uniref:Uncharacterized protein n=1 Tax=Triticum turgidum subsp. durum TaxID=4567 RepID=A0A9R1NNJ1_TRITD|nr:unnamed protein product [Triticum turgidum subsp. durum]
MAPKNSAVFLLGLLLSCVAMSSAARILEETAPSRKNEVHLPPKPELPKVELPTFPEVYLPPKPEMPKVELPTFPEVHLPPKPEMSKVELTRKPEMPKVELPPKPELPTVPVFHFPKPEDKP